MTTPRISKHLVNNPVENVQLAVKLFETHDPDNTQQRDLPAIVLVHPYSKLGGNGETMAGLASELSIKGMLILLSLLCLLCEGHVLLVQWVNTIL